MNTEPPEGDDLQRMLVSMKQNVLDRATPRPKRRRGRSGIVIGVVAVLAIGTATGAVALTLAQQDQPTAAPAQTQEPAPTTSTPNSAPITATPRPTPTPTTTSTPATSEPDVRIPGDCYLLVPDADYSRLFGAARSTSVIWMPDGRGREPDGNDRIQGLRDPDEALSCTWQNEGVVANISIVVRPAAGSASEETSAAVRESDPTCEDRLGGRVCSWRPGTDSGADVRGTYFTRGNLTISITQTDFPTNGLLDAIVGKIWGD